MKRKLATLIAAIGLVGAIAVPASAHTNGCGASLYPNFIVKIVPIYNSNHSWWYWVNVYTQRYHWHYC